MGTKFKKAIAWLIVGVWYLLQGVLEDLAFGSFGNWLRGIAVPYLNLEQSLVWLVRYMPAVFAVAYGFYYTIPELFLSAKEKESDKHDVWLSDAIIYMINRDWDDDSFVFELEEGVSNKFTALYKMYTEIEQRAGDGELVIYGKVLPYEAGNYLEIPSTHWSDHKLQFTFVSSDDEQPQGLRTECRFPGQVAGERFHQLKTSRERVEEIWPPKRGIVRLWNSWKRPKRQKI